MKLIRKNDKEGFTLVELIVVIAILAILALILIPAITGYIEKSNWSSVESTARSVYSEVILDLETGTVKAPTDYVNDNFKLEIADKAEELAGDEVLITVTKAGSDKYEAEVTRDGVVQSDNLDAKGEE